MNKTYINEKYHPSTPEVIVLEMSYLFMKNFNYLIVDSVSGKAVIVDPAWQMEKIDQAIKDTGSELSGVLVTHTHPDHIHLANDTAEKYRCPIWMSNAEIASSRFSAPRLVGIDEVSWSVGGMEIQPILTPGHTPGCICYLIGDNLFTGDVLFAEGCGICPDIQAAYNMFASLEYLKTKLRPTTRIFPGHSYGKQPGQLFSLLLKENIYLQFDSKESFAAFRLRSGQKRSKIFDFK